MDVVLSCASLLLCISSRAAHAFVVHPRGVAYVLHAHANGPNMSAASRGTYKKDEGSTRAGIAKILGAAAAGTLAVNVAPCSAARTRAELIQLLGSARKQLEPVDKLIEDAKWDAIRNILKTSPLADIKNIIAELARQSDDDESSLLLGLRQDVLDHVQYLDSFSYNNVFVGEERRILGTKIDFDTPRMELRQAREAFDIVMEVLPPADST